MTVVGTVLYTLCTGDHSLGKKIQKYVENRNISYHEIPTLTIVDILCFHDDIQMDTINRGRLWKEIMRKNNVDTMNEEIVRELAHIT